MMTTVVKGKTVKQVNDLFDKFHKLCTGESDEAELDEFEDEVLNYVLCRSALISYESSGYS